LKTVLQSTGVYVFRRKEAISAPERQFSDSLVPNPVFMVAAVNHMCSQLRPPQVFGRSSLRHLESLRVAAWQHQ
jgi:hypothetical protein